MYHKSKEKVRLDEYIYVQIVRSVDIYNNKKVRSVKKNSSNICIYQSIWQSGCLEGNKYPSRVSKRFLITTKDYERQQQTTILPVYMTSLLK